MAKRLAPHNVPTHLLAFTFDGTRVPGLRSLSPSGGERSVTQVRDFDGVTVATGVAEVSAYSAAFSPSPALKIWNDLYDSWVDGTVKAISIKTKKIELYKSSDHGDTLAAIAADGVVTFSGGTAKQRPDADKGHMYVGSVISVKNKLHPINEVDGKTAKVDVPSAASGAGDAFSIIMPSLTWKFNGIIVGPVVPNFADDAADVTMSIQPVVTLPKAEIS